MTVIRCCLVDILDQRFSVASPNFKTTTFLFSTTVVWSKGGYTRIANTWGGFPSFHPLYYPHDFSHKIIKNGRFIRCATSPSVQWVIATYEAIHCQWVSTLVMQSEIIWKQKHHSSTQCQAEKGWCLIYCLLLLHAWSKWQPHHKFSKFSNISFWQTRPRAHGSLTLLQGSALRNYSLFII